jgi:hypothetical protein
MLTPDEISDISPGTETTLLFLSLTQPHDGQTSIFPQWNEHRGHLDSFFSFSVGSFLVLVSASALRDSTPLP